uniref:hypothetical protein n=1 Tax=Paractinoplanes polyasparticus TaxID=2856853 RepID=UPI001C862F68|nr:hypothetical protein [Actinoplanes polyasparticus]
MTDVHVTFRPNRRGQTAAGNSNAVYRELERRADKVIGRALEAYAPHSKTGEYGRSFEKQRTRIRGQAAVQVVNTAPHADILERGSGPHIIRPKNAQALFWPGARRPVAKVNHPGTPAYHFLRNALRAAGR